MHVQMCGFVSFSFFYLSFYATKISETFLISNSVFQCVGGNLILTKQPVQNMLPTLFGSAPISDMLGLFLHSYIF